MTYDNMPTIVVQVEGKRTWDKALIGWLMALADQGIVTEADRVAVPIEGSDADHLAVGHLLRYVMRERGWPEDKLLEFVLIFCGQRSVGDSIRWLADAWRRHQARD